MSPSKSNAGGPPQQPTAIERQALDWLARVDAGMTPAQELEFERWLAANPQHAEAFAEFDGTWNLLDHVRETPEAAALSRRISESDPSRCRDRGGRFRALPWLLATAAAVMVFSGAFWWRLKPDRAAGNVEYATSTASAVGAMQILPLPDGSTIRLNTDSAVDVRYTAGERRIRLLHGEAHFTVAKNPARPFIVSASGVDVRAIGTAFNVRMRNEAVEVVVTSGKVAVNDDQGRSLLSLEASTDRAPALPDVSQSNAVSETPVRSLIAGEKITIPLGSDANAIPSSAPPVALAAVEMERTLAWQQRRLRFDSAPLSDMVAEFNRYNREKLIIGDARLAAERFGGTFRADDPIGFVRMLEANYGVRSERHGTEIVLRLAQ